MRDLISKIRVVEIDVDESAREGWTSVHSPVKLTLRNHCAGLKLEIERTTFEEYDTEDIQSAVKVILMIQAFEDVGSGRIG